MQSENTGKKSRLILFNQLHFTETKKSKKEKCLKSNSLQIW